MKLTPVRIEEKPLIKTPTKCQGNERSGVRTAIRRVKGPTRINATHEDGQHGEGSADDVEVVAQEIQAGEGHIAGTDLQRDEKVAQHRRDRGDQKEEDHHHPVHGEELVVGLGLDQIAFGRHQLKADHTGEKAAGQEEDRQRYQIEDADALVV